MVVSDLTVSREDLDWMQPIRAEHDELYYSAINPHFTFVFPVFGFDREKFGGARERTDRWRPEDPLRVQMRNRRQGRHQRVHPLGFVIMC